MSIPPDVIDRIRQLPIENVLALLGVRRWGRAWYCPFHEDRRPSAGVKHNKLRCFACSDRSWSTIDLVMKSVGLDFVGAVRWLADHFGVSIPDHQLSRAERQDLARRLADARSSADNLTDWRQWQESNLRLHRDLLWRNAQFAHRWTLAHLNDSKFDDDPRWDVVWSAIERAEVGDLLNEALNHLESLTPAECLVLRNRVEAE